MPWVMQVWIACWGNSVHGREAAGATGLVGRAVVVGQEEDARLAHGDLPGRRDGILVGLRRRVVGGVVDLVDVVAPYVEALAHERVVQPPVDGVIPAVLLDGHGPDLEVRGVVGRAPLGGQDRLDVRQEGDLHDAADVARRVDHAHIDRHGGTYVLDHPVQLAAVDSGATAMSGEVAEDVRAGGGARTATSRTAARTAPPTASGWRRIGAGRYAARGAGSTGHDETGVARQARPSS